MSGHGILKATANQYIQKNELLAMCSYIIFIFAATETKGKLCGDQRLRNDLIDLIAQTHWYPRWDA